MRKYITAIIFTLFSAICFAQISVADENLSQRLSGYMLLQVESHGKAWYVNPDNCKKYYLGRPSSAFDIMRKLGTGITNENLSKFTVGIIEYNDKANKAVVPTVSVL